MTASSTAEWVDIVEHVLVLRGIDSSGSAPVIKFVADSVLRGTDRTNGWSAIGFDVEVSLPNGSHPILHRRRHGMYQSPVTFRDELVGLRNGTVLKATLSLTDLEMTIYRTKQRMNQQICVEGIVSSDVEARCFPWPRGKLGTRDWHTSSDLPAHWLRFAFLTSLIDPPHLDSFRQGFDGLLTYLDDFESLCPATH